LIGLLLLAANVLALGPLVWRGGLPDRAAVLSVALYIVAGEFLESVMWGDWRVGSASLDLALLLCLWWLTLRADRWWLVLVTGFQLIAVGTHLIPLVKPGYFFWTGTTIRLVIWGFISISFIVGAWEVWAARRFAREERNHGTSRTIPLDAG
jgi:hypothetical protein